MKKILITLLFTLSVYGVDTDLPGDINALPNQAHTVPHGVCSYNPTGTFKICLRGLGPLTGNGFIDADDTAIYFDRNVQVATSVDVGGPGGTNNSLHLFHSGSTNTFSIKSSTTEMTMTSISLVYQDIASGHNMVQLLTTGGASFRLGNQAGTIFMTLDSSGYTGTALAGFGTMCVGSNNSGTLQLGFAGTCITTAGGQTISLSDTFTNGLSVGSGGVLPSSDNVSRLGTSSLRFLTSEIEQMTARSASGGNALCFFSVGGFLCNNSSSVTIVQLDINGNFLVPSGGTMTLAGFAGSGTKGVQVNNSGVLSLFTIPSGGVSSVSGTAPIASSGGTTPAISCATCLQGASGKKHVNGIAQFSSGSQSVATGLSSIDSVSGVQVTGGGTPTEFIGFATNSGGTVTFKSSNASSSAFFFWEADGNP